MAPKKARKTPAVDSSTRTIAIAKLVKDPALRKKVEGDLRKGFKWYKNGVTDGCTGDFAVTIAPTGKITINYGSKKGLFNPRGSVMKTTIAMIHKVEYNGPVGEMYPFVHPKGTVNHYNWRGELAATF